MKTKILVYADFDNEVIGFQENLLDWEVGEFINEDGRKKMVYALFDLSPSAMFAMKREFRKIALKYRPLRYVDRLNKVVEELIELTHDQERCERITKMAMMKSYADLQRALSRMNF